MHAKNLFDSTSSTTMEHTSSSPPPDTKAQPSSSQHDNHTNIPELVARKHDALLNWLQQIRKQQGLELRWVARQSHLSAGQISRLENRESALTIFSLLKLCYGLGIDAISVAEQLGISTDILEQRMGAMHNHESPTLTAPLISRFSQIYKKNPEHVSNRLQPWFTKLGIFSKMPFNPDAVAYPSDAPAEIVRQAYIRGDSMLLEDAGAFIRSWRKTKGLKIEELARSVGMSFGALQKFETGIIKRMKFENILALNVITSNDYGGAFFGICWAAGMFHLGIHNLEANKENERKVTLPAWEKEEWAFAEAMVNITRTAHVEGQREAWLQEIRSIVTEQG